MLDAKEEIPKQEGSGIGTAAMTFAMIELGMHVVRPKW